MNEHTRRAFLGRGIQAAGLLGLTFRPTWARAGDTPGIGRADSEGGGFPAAPAATP